MQQHRWNNGLLTSVSITDVFRRFEFSKMQLHLCSNVYKSEFPFSLLTKVSVKESVLSKVCVTRTVVSKNQPNYRKRKIVILQCFLTSNKISSMKKSYKIPPKSSKLLKTNNTTNCISRLSSYCTVNTLRLVYIFISFSSLSYDRSKASSKASSPHRAI